MATSRRLIILCVLVCFLLVEASEGSKARHYKWDVEYLFWSPDCVENVVMGINGQFPGPTIRAKAGDMVVVELTNKLHTEGVVIHWHGIRQVRLLLFFLLFLKLAKPVCSSLVPELDPAPRILE